MQDNESHKNQTPAVPLKTHSTMENTTSISEMYPNLLPLYIAIRDYVQEHQGEKGYIDTQHQLLDAMHYYEESEDYCGAFNEGRICGLRVYENELQFVGTYFANEFYDEASFKMCTENYELFANPSEDTDEYDSSEMWQPIFLNDSLLYAETLLSICESIEEYC